MENRSFEDLWPNIQLAHNKRTFFCKMLQNDPSLPTDPSWFRSAWKSEPRKKTSYFPLYWLVTRDPYNGLLESPYNWVMFVIPQKRKKPTKGRIFFSLEIRYGLDKALTAIQSFPHTLTLVLRESSPSAAIHSHPGPHSSFQVYNTPRRLTAGSPQPIPPQKGKGETSTQTTWFFGEPCWISGVYNQNQWEKQAQKSQRTSAWRYDNPPLNGFFHAVGVERIHWDGRFGRISQGFLGLG